MNQINPLICPLCKKENSCVNLGTADTGRTCWCNDPDIKFPAELLEKVPQEKRKQACICKACVLSFLKNGS